MTIEVVMYGVAKLRKIKYLYDKRNKWIVDYHRPEIEKYFDPRDWTENIIEIITEGDKIVTRYRSIGTYVAANR